MTDYSLLLACRTCDTPGIVFTDPDERDATVHGHDTAPYALATEHPDHTENDPATFPAGSRVTFWGSTTGDTAGYVHATVDHATDNVTSNGEHIKGYVVTVDGWHLFAPATALRAAAQ